MNLIARLSKGLRPSPLPQKGFQILSDLHLEVGRQYGQYHFPAIAHYLVLAGDIGKLADYESYLSFVKRQIDRFQNVFLVLGNHEFYGATYDVALSLAAKLEAEPSLQSKLILLHRKRFDIPQSNVTILGCSLWSHIPDGAKDVVTSRINDFRRIESWTPEAHNAAHERDLAWLRNEVSDLRSRTGNEQRSVLVVTHHAPCVEGTSEPRLTHSPWSSAFATDLLEDATEWAGVDAWVYGHTHYSTQFKKNGVRIVSNQKGSGWVRDMQRGRLGRFNEAFVLNL